eukprot:COSAG01_NODE_6980_length_3406_cov_32.821288_1_plen_87_part_00
MMYPMMYHHHEHTLTHFALDVRRCQVSLTCVQSSCGSSQQSLSTGAMYEFMVLKELQPFGPGNGVTDVGGGGGSGGGGDGGVGTIT